MSKLWPPVSASRASRALFLAGLVLAPATVQAAPRAKSSPRVASAPADSRLSPEDVISISVLRHPELSVESITVPSSGRINLPEAGQIVVTGKTVSQLRAAIQRALERTMVAPEVTVSLVEQAKRQVVVLGAVASSGRYDIKPGWRVSEVLAASSFKPNRVDEVVATLARPSGEVVRINLAAILANPASPQNLRLRPNDVLTLQALEPKRVTVNGDVVRPDVYELRRARTLIDAINAAQGLKGRAGDYRGFVLRKGRRIELNLEDANEFRTSAANLKLQAGDLINLQLAPKRITVTGDVNKPNQYELRRAPTLLDAINAAEGLKGAVEDTVGTLVRGGKRIELKLEDASALKNSASNIKLQSGDFVDLKLAPKRITVTGDVAKPEQYNLRRTPTLLDAINAVGGFKQSASETRGYILRRGKRIELRVEDAVQYREAAANVRLEDGDLVSFEAIPRLRVTVSGLFARKPDNYELMPDAGVVQAITQAGGPSVPYDQVVVTVRRRGQIIPVDLERASVDSNADIALRDGDLILLSEAPGILKVSVTGQVKTPGALRLAAGTTVQKAIADAGGLSIKPESARISILRNLLRNRASSTNVSTEGARQLAIKVDANSLYNRNDLNQNVLLEDGDLVTVTDVQAVNVIIGGEVEDPGPYAIQEGESLAELFARAGGQTENAALTRVVLQRGAERRIVDAYDVVRNGAASNITLESGDVISVPRNEARVTVMQAVQKPGDYALPERRPLTVVDALNLAGGPRDRAIFKEVVLVRPNPSAPNGLERRLVRVDKVGLADPSSNVTLQNGDVIYVPEFKGRISPLGILGQAVGAVLGLRAVTGR